MTKKIILGLAVVALAVAIATPAANANCGSIRSASTYANGVAVYWHSPLPAGGNLVGRSWQLGGGTSAWDSSTGVVPCQGFLYFSAGGINLNLDLASCGGGCPATNSTLAVLAQHQPAGGTQTAFLLDTVTETPANTINFDYTSQGDHNLIVQGKPTIVSSSRAPGQVTLNLSFPSVTGGLYGPNAGTSVSGYRVVSARSAVNPGRDAAAFNTPLLTGGTVAAAGGGPAAASVTLDCSVLTDQWVATQILFEGNAIASGAVSEPRQVHCDPALADPKFKIVPKKHDTTLIPGNNQNN
jgi:hypothetical protein